MGYAAYIEFMAAVIVIGLLKTFGCVTMSDLAPENMVSRDVACQGWHIHPPPPPQNHQTEFFKTEGKRAMRKASRDDDSGSV